MGTIGSLAAGKKCVMVNIDVTFILSHSLCHSTVQVGVSMK